MRVKASYKLLTSGIAEPTQGWFSAFYPDGSIYIFVGTASHLWVGIGSSFSENAGGQVFTGGSNLWTFAIVGSTVIATNGHDSVQAVTTEGGQFSALGGNPPIASIVSNADPGGTGFFAFLFNLQSNPQGWACSGAGQPNSWPLDVSNLSATGTLGLTPGSVTAATPLRGGSVAFKANSFYYGQFVGAPFVWQFVLVSPSQGVAGPYAYANAGDAVYFVGNDNIYSFDGFSLSVVPNALAEWLVNETLDNNHAGNIVGSYDSANDIVSFYFPSKQASPAGTLDTLIMWCRRSGHWCVDHVVTQGALQANIAAVPAATYTTMTTIFPTYASILLGTTYAILAPTASRNSATGVFLPDNNLYTATGPVRQINTYFTTSDIGHPERITSLFRSRLNWSLIALDSNIRLVGLGKDLEGQPPFLITTSSSMGPRGFFDFRQTARWNNLQFFLAGDCEVTGYEVLIADAGVQ
ncbi:MAG: hypothetical protein KGJ90_01930 [Patescibacteria group bacterium]|nr:hypothetical protein [Patescibacteria group bacterium]